MLNPAVLMTSSKPDLGSNEQYLSISILVCKEKRAFLSPVALGHRPRSPVYGISGDVIRF
jgi:hypothetical protein